MSRTIGEQIRRAREDKGLSQRALGEQVGLSDKMISRIERGFNTTTQVIDKIAAVLEIRIVFDGGNSSPFDQQAPRPAA